MTIVPESATRLQATMFVDRAEIMNAERSDILREAARHMAESALRKIIHDCIRSEGDYMGYRGSTLKLDVYVFSPEELHKMLLEARMQGQRDAERFRDLWGYSVCE